MIKVLMIGNHPSNKGGMTSVISQIREYDWSKEGVELTFIPTFFPGNHLVKSLYFLCSFIRILFCFLFSRPDLVHMHMSYKGSFTRKNLIRKMCRFFHISSVIHLHGSEFEKWYSASSERKKKSIREMLAGCDRFVVLGNEWKDVVLNIEPKTKVSVISNGIRIPQQSVHWNEDRCQLLFLGVLIPRKGVSDLVKSVSDLKEAGLLGNRVLVIAGTGEEEEKLKQQVKDADLNDEISFAGWVSGAEKEALFLNSQVLISPSYNEGLPISILEAASYGMPIVSTDVGDIASVVKDGINGVLVQPGDTDAISEGILKATSYELFARMSIESRNIIANSFSISVFYSKLSDMYHELGEANGRP